MLCQKCNKEKAKHQLMEAIENPESCIKKK